MNYNRQGAVSSAPKELSELQGCGTLGTARPTSCLLSHAPLGNIRHKWAPDFKP